MSVTIVPPVVLYETGIYDGIIAICDLQSSHYIDSVNRAADHSDNTPRDQAFVPGAPTPEGTFYCTE